MMNFNFNHSKAILWTIYIALLGVLLPHTAWAFSLFEPSGSGWLNVKWGVMIAWLAAFVFESAIAALTHRLSEHIERVPNYKDWWKKFSNRYVNAYSLGLLMAVMVSTFANLAHAVEYSQTMAIFENWGIPQGVYSIAFGAILPFCSLLFARIISDVNDIEQEENQEAVQLKKALKDAGSKVKQVEAELAKSRDDLQAAQGKLQVIENRYSKEIADLQKQLTDLQTDIEKANDTEKLWMGVTPLNQAIARHVILGEKTQSEIASEYGTYASKVSRVVSEVKEHLQNGQG